MVTDLKKTSKGIFTFFLSLIIILWLIIGVSTLFLKQNERQMTLTNWDNSLCVVNDMLAVLVKKDSIAEAYNFGDVYRSLYRGSSFEDIFITVRRYNGSLISSNDLNNSAKNPNYIDTDSIACVRIRDGLAPNSGRRSSLGQERIYVVSTYPELDLMISTEVVFSGNYKSKIEQNADQYLLGAIIIGLLITIMLVAYMLRYMYSVERLFSIFACISQNTDPKDLIKYRWHRSVGIVARQIARIYSEKLKIIEEHYSERERAIAEEQHDMHARRILTNNLRHELKTPIGIISGYIETILEHPDLPKELQQKFLNSCLRDIRRINNLVTSLSLLSRLEDGSDAIIYEDIELNDFMLDIIDEFTPKLREANMKFDLDIPDDMHVLSSNSSLYALFNNLIKNSINYSRGKTMGLKYVCEKDEFYEFKFWDDGVGVDEEYLQHLFERFFRIEKDITRVTDGTGLGLSIVKLVVDNHGGTIDVQNGETGGLVYTFTLPKVLKQAD